MIEIIKDIEKLAEIAEPVEFITEQGIDRAEGDEIITKIKEVMMADPSIIALAAPQIGIKSRIFCIKFNEEIKTFINPIVTKKSNYAIRPESFLSMPNKEILITRPEELTVVYYTADFKYEENKLLGAAARIFDQHCQLLDGITPADLGLVSDIEIDGSLADLSEEEVTQVTEIYKQYIKIKTAAMQKEIQKNPELEKQYKALNFTEKVITGEVAVVAEDEQKKHKKAQNIAALSLKNTKQSIQNSNRNNLANFLKKKGK